MFCIRPKIWHPISKHSHRICLEHQHGRHDVIWKRSIAEMDLQKTKEVYKSFWPEKVDHGVLVAPLCYFSLLLVVSAERCSPTYKLPLKEKQRRKIFGWPLVAFKKVKWRTTRKCIVHERTPFPPFSRPWPVFPRCVLLAGWPTATFPALSASYFVLPLGTSHALFTDYKPNIRSVKCFLSHRKRVTIFFVSAKH